MSDPKTHYKLMNETEFLSEPWLQGRDVTLTIASVGPEQLEEQSDDKKQKRRTVTKPVMRFVGSEKKWVLNKINQDSIVKLYGVYTDDWIGKKITLHPTTCPAFGNPKTPCIRVRPTVPTQAKPTSDQMTDAERAAILAKEGGEPQ